MSKISTEDIQKLGMLARVAISDAHAETLAPQLEEIITYVAKLSSVDTTDTPITTQVSGLIDVWREDEIKPSPLSRDELLVNAPATQDGYIKVRRVK